jgi:nitrate reductase alpha subunit
MKIQWPEEVECWKNHQERDRRKSRRKKQRGKRNGQRSRLEWDAAADYAVTMGHLRAIKQEGGDDSAIR